MRISNKIDNGQEDRTIKAMMETYTQNYWHFVDRNNDGLLNYSEYKMAWSDIVGILVQVGLQIDALKSNFQNRNMM